VLSGENPDGGAWSDAGAYLETVGRSEKPSQAPILRILQEPSGQYRVLIVPGFMSACVTDSMWPGLPIVPSKSTGATDGKYLRAAGIPTYGVQGFELDRDNSRMHGEDERIAVRSFYEGQTFLCDLVKDLAGPQ
jgi:acetylornithine deacetylase/succinyl-diaminopimelate desuccinylase-like protein